MTKSSIVLALALCVFATLTEQAQAKARSQKTSQGNTFQVPKDEDMPKYIEGSVDAIFTSGYSEIHLLVRGKYDLFESKGFNMVPYAEICHDMIKIDEAWEINGLKAPSLSNTLILSESTFSGGVELLLWKSWSLRILCGVSHFEDSDYRSYENPDQQWKLRWSFKATYKHSKAFTWSAHVSYHHALPHVWTWNINARLLPVWAQWQKRQFFLMNMFYEGLKVDSISVHKYGVAFMGKFLIHEFGLKGGMYVQKHKLANRSGLFIGFSVSILF
ncbi:MAG: hypothetical protein HY453_00250 [Parcubacteria group bacterium]|nr:hypothetical protein [Parcubacteria group bacterium]